MLVASLQEVFDFLIDRDTTCPASRSVRSALDIAGEQLDTRQQAAHTAHMAVTVTPHLVADAVQGQQPVLERLQGREDLRQRKIVTLLFR